MEVDRTSIKAKLGTTTLTSLITFGLEAASKDLSFTLKMACSCGFSWKYRVNYSASGEWIHREC